MCGCFVVYVQNEEGKQNVCVVFVTFVCKTSKSGILSMLLMVYLANQ